MAIVKCRDPRSGITYVYTSDCYYDEEQGKYRYKRKCIGKVDPETGETVPTGPKGGYRPKKERPPVDEDNDEPRKPGRKPKKEPSPEYARTLKQMEELKGENFELKQQVRDLQNDLKQLQKKLNNVKKQMEQMAAELS